MTNVTYLRSSTDGAAAHALVSLLDRAPADDFDPRPIKRLCERMPLHEAEDQICRLLEDIALRLEQLQRGLAARDLKVMAPAARRVALTGRQMGLLEVADSAQHVGRCLATNDGVALQAVMARLERAFDVAVNEAWNLREM